MSYLPRTGTSLGSGTAKTSGGSDLKSLLNSLVGQTVASKFGMGFGSGNVGGNADVGSNGLPLGRGQANLSGGSDISSQLQAIISKAFQNHVIPNEPPNAEVDPYLAALGQLYDQAGGGGGKADYQQSLEDSNKLIRQAFGSQIGGVKQANRYATKKTKANNKQIDAMYRALGKNYAEAAGAEIGHGKEAAAAQQTVANNAQNSVQGSASTLLDQQAALAKGLGLESTEPTTSAPQIAATNAAVANIQSAGQRDASAALQYSGSQQRALDRQGTNSVLEGTNRQADLIAQLQDYLNGNASKIADIKGQEGSALASNRASVASSMAASNDKSTAERLAILKQINEYNTSKAKGAEAQHKTSSVNQSKALELATALAKQSGITDQNKILALQQLIAKQLGE